MPHDMINYDTIVDLVKHSQVDAAGELLRRIFFKPEYHSYEFFDIIEVRLGKTPIPWVDFFGEDFIVRSDCPDPHEFHKRFYNQTGSLKINDEITVVCHVYNDGDTIIIFKSSDFVLVNTDAKKQYWEYYDSLDNFYLKGT